MTEEIKLKNPTAKKAKSEPKTDGFTATMPVAALKSAVNICAKFVVDRRVTIPVLSCLRLSAEGGVVSLIATDLDIELSMKVQAEQVAKGSVCVDAHALGKILKEADSTATITITHDPVEDRAKASTSSVKYSLASIPAADFPSFPASKADFSFKADGADLRRLFTKTRFAISTEETRYYLNGVYLHVVDGKLRAVATDGHRLARVDMAAPNEWAASAPGIIVHRKAVDLIRFIMRGGCEVAVSAENKISIDGPGWTVRSKLIDGTFPDYTRVIPDYQCAALSVDTDNLRKGLRRVCAVSTEKSRAVGLDLTPDNVALSVNAPDAGTAESSIPATYAGESFCIGFNGSYVIEILEQIDGERVEFRASDPASPTAISDPTDDSAIYVVMPMLV